MKLFDGINGGIVWNRMHEKAACHMWMRFIDMSVTGREKTSKEIGKLCFVYFWYKIKPIFTQTKTKR